jgi:hypothetical protein
LQALRGDSQFVADGQTDALAPEIERQNPSFGAGWIGHGGDFIIEGFMLE